MKKLKHSKFRNTGILFEILVRKLTSETIVSDKSDTIDIIKKYFGKRTELAKEIRLYNHMINEQFKSEASALDYIRSLKKSYDNLNKTKLRREKYNLVKEIKEKFDLDQITKLRIPNYKVLASAYMIFEYNEEDNPKQLMECKSNIIQGSIKEPVTKTPEDALYESYKNEPKEIRLLAYKLLVNKFNNKYSSLNENQKKLLNKYIVNVDDTIELKEYVSQIIPEIKAILKSHIEKIDDSVTKIKVTKLSEMLCDVENINMLKESHILNLMRYYDLISELDEIHNA